MNRNVAFGWQDAFRPSAHLGVLCGVVVFHALLVLWVARGKPEVTPVTVPPMVVDLVEIGQPSAKPIPVAESKPAKTKTTKLPNVVQKQARQEKTEPSVKQLVNDKDESNAPSVHASSDAKVASASSAAEKASSDAMNRGSKAAAGEAVVNARFDAAYLKNPAPPYPPLSKRMGEEGKVTLRVLVSNNGLAEKVELEASSGSPRLDSSALKTVRDWKFIPAQRGGQAVQSWVLVPISFKLES